jgi:lysophospholipase L1-like esterase
MWVRFPHLIYLLPCSATAVHYREFERQQGVSMRHLVGVLLVATTMISACGGNSSPPAKPEIPVLTAPPEPGVTYVAVIGDSFTGGSSSGGEGPNGWPSIVTTMLANQGSKVKLVVGAKSGSGYVRHSTRGSVPFVNQIGQVVAAKDSLVVLFGSPYDQTSIPDRSDKLSATIMHTLAEVKKAAPKAKLLIIGPAWVQPNPPIGILQVRDLVKEQAESAGALFVDPLAEDWFAGHPEMVGQNGDSPNDAGHVLMAARIAPLIAQQLMAAPVS